MSPEAKRTFEREWAVLSRRLRLLLVRKGVNPNLHDDLVQETALRLLSMWDSVDRRRPLWPLTVTIALNLLRDRGRVVTKDDLVAEIPELGAVHDVEAAGLARVELERVRRAMGELSRSQRSALMKEVGGHALSSAPDTSSEKMLRMRARRKLKIALENVSGLVALRIRRIVDVVEAAFAAKEAAVSAASCVVCLVIGFGATIAPPASLTPHAAAGPVDVSWGGAVQGAGSAVDEVAVSGVPSADEPRPGDAARAEAGDPPATGPQVGNSRARGNADGGGATGENGGNGALLDVLPQDGDQVGPPPTDGAVSVDGNSPPLPGGDSDGEPIEPPSQPPPAPPPAPPINPPVPLPPAVEDPADIL